MGTSNLAEPGLTSPFACQVAGITFRQLDYWHRTGLVTPSVQDSAGSGTARLWSRDDVARLRLIRVLIDNGISLRRIRSIIGHYGEFPDFGGYLMLTGRNLWGGDISAVVGAVRRRDVTLVINTAVILHDVNQAIDENRERP